MGPRPNGRGKLKSPGEIRGYLTFNGAAAKRPRKGHVAGAHQAAALPSMGPRPNGRGKLNSV